MTIVQISSHINGSVGKIMRDIHSALIARGESSYILYARGNAPEIPNAIKVNSKFGIYCDALKTRLFDNAGRNSYFATKKIISLLKKISPDVIHLHCLHGYYINYKLLFRYLKQADVKVVWTMHDCWAYTGHCCYYSYADCEKWQRECDNCSYKSTYPKSSFFDRAKKNFILKKKYFTSLNREKVILVVPSKWLKSQLENSFLNIYNIKVVYNGISLDVFRPIETPIKKQLSLHDKKIILGVANVWEPRKGLEDFIYLSKNLNSSYKIVVVGVSEKQKLSLPENIISLSRTDSLDKLIQMYAAADWFFNPSVEETFGMTSIEALACGTPVIVYNKTALPEIIDESCGKIFNNVEEVIEFFAKKADTTTISVSSCVERANVFSLENMLEGYFNLYGF